MHIKTGARQDVLDFYKTLPFNKSTIPEIAAAYIKSENPIPYIFPDSDSLFDISSAVEIGCGTGWLSNAMSYYYGVELLGIDFNPVAIDFARRVADILGINVQFKCEDLFEFQPSFAPDLVISNGVLHQTNDCMGGVGKCINLLPLGGRLFIGLYNKYARAPFLEHFAAMREAGKEENDLLEENRRLDKRHSDDVQEKSWFLDQVLHPYETQHTLDEVIMMFQKNGVKLVSTSINGYESISDLAELYSLGKNLYDVGVENLKHGDYYPGFFYVYGEKCE